MMNRKHAPALVLLFGFLTVCSQPQPARQEAPPDQRPDEIVKRQAGSNSRVRRLTLPTQRRVRRPAFVYGTYRLEAHVEGKLQCAGAVRRGRITQGVEGRF